MTELGVVDSEPTIADDDADHGDAPGSIKRAKITKLRDYFASSDSAESFLCSLCRKVVKAPSGEFRSPHCATYYLDNQF
jgi:hypothetical protein